MRSVRSWSVSALAFALTLVASPVASQTCLGLPLYTGQSSVGVGAFFLDGADAYGVSATTRIGQNLSFAGNYTLTQLDEIAGVKLPSMHTSGARATYEVPVSQNRANAAVGVCPNVGAAYTSWEDVGMISVPVGVGLGATISVSDNLATITPYVNPAFYWTRASLEGFDAESSTDFGVTAGATLNVSNLYFGAGYTQIGDADGNFSVGAGLIF